MSTHSEFEETQPLRGVNIAIVANTSWNIYNFRRPLAKILQRAGAKITCFAPADDTSPLIRQTGFELVELQHLNRKSINPRSDLRLVRELRGHYKQRDIHLALQFTPKVSIFGSIAGKRAKTTTISTITGLGYAFIGKLLLRKIVSILYRYALRGSPATIFQNQDDLNLFVSRKIIPASQTRIIRGSGVDTDKFTDSQSENTSRDFTSFLFVGRLLVDKGIMEFLEAAQAHLKSFPNNRFHIVGSIDPGNPASISSELVDHWNSVDNIFFHGNSDDVKSYLDSCDACVLPSYREGLPRVMLEAMASGKPCITTDVPGCREVVIDKETGFLVAVKDAFQLAAAFDRFAATPPEVQRQMGKAGRQRVIENFSDQIVTQQYLETVISALGNR